MCNFSKGYNFSDFFFKGKVVQLFTRTRKCVAQLLIRYKTSLIQTDLAVGGKTIKADGVANGA